MYGFRYHRPATIADAEQALSLAGEDARPLAGGMSLIPVMKHRLAAPGDLIDLSTIDGLAGIGRENDRLVIKAMTRHAAVAAWLGLAVGLAIRTSGAVFTFGCLVLPGLVAKSVCRETRPVLVLAPLVATAATAAAFVLAHGLDWPPAHTAVAILCGAVALAWGARVSSAE